MSQSGGSLYRGLSSTLATTTSQSANNARHDQHRSSTEIAQASYSPVYRQGMRNALFSAANFWPWLSLTTTLSTYPPILVSKSALTLMPEPARCSNSANVSIFRLNVTNFC